MCLSRILKPSKVDFLRLSDDFLMAYCVSGVVFYLQSILASLQKPIWKSAKHFILSFRRTTYSLTGRSINNDSHTNSPMLMIVLQNQHQLMKQKQQITKPLLLLCHSNHVIQGVVLRYPCT